MRLILKAHKGPFPATPVGLGGEAGSGAFIGVHWYASGPAPGPVCTVLRETASTTFLQRGPWAWGGSDGSKVKSSMGTGPTVEGTADAAQGVGDKEGFTNEKPRELGFGP